MPSAEGRTNIEVVLGRRSGEHPRSAAEAELGVVSVSASGKRPATTRCSVAREAGAECLVATSRPRNVLRATVPTTCIIGFLDPTQVRHHAAQFHHATA
jgi:hypothetical protein